MTAPLRTTGFVDSEQVVKDWVNSQTRGVVGRGAPIALGAHLRRLRSPFRGSYLLLSVIGSPQVLTAEWVDASARISASVYGVTKESAAAAAVAYANLLTTVSRERPRVGSVQMITVDAVTGPVHIPDYDEERYIVDADFYFLRA